MTDDDTQLFDPESGALNPRAADTADCPVHDPADDEGDDLAARGTTPAGESGEHVQQVTPIIREVYDVDGHHVRYEPIDGPREHARTTDPSTSQRAAQGREKNRSLRRDTDKHHILTAFDYGTELTSDEACEHAARTHNPRLLTGWRRVSDLTKGGYLTETGDERPSRQGRPQRVLRITNRGEDALRFFAETDRKVYRP